MITKSEQMLVKESRESRKLILHEIRLAESSCKLGTLRPNELPDNATQSVGVGNKLASDGKGVLVVVTCKLVASYGPSPSDDPTILITARFGMHYEMTKPIAGTHFDEIIEKVAMTVAWPYWRELVNSLTVRMGLPAFPVPLFHMAALPKFKPKRSRGKPAAGEA